MPKWLSSTMIAIGFLALVILAFLPRNLEVTVTTNVDDQDSVVTDGSLHSPPDTASDEDGGS